MESFLNFAVDAPDRHRDKRQRLLSCPHTFPGKPICIVTLPTADFQGSRIDIINLWRTNRLITKLPTVEALRALVEKPLTDSEKIPIPDSFFLSFISGSYPDMCDRNDISTLFTIGEFDANFMSVILAVTRSPPSGGTEESFHSFWDGNIRNMIELLLPSGTSIRDCETKNLRPDFGFLLDTACPFRGEEEGTENPTHPKAELVNKLVCVYSHAPYMLGIKLVSVYGLRSVISSSDLPS